jgi:polyisoprenoid-binding protein YceI
VSKFPTLTFKSTSCKKVKGKKYLIKGNLSMHGITKEVLIIATHNGNTKNRGGMDVAGFKFTSSFKRSDFGIGTELPFSIVADQVELSSDMELVKN